MDRLFEYKIRGPNIKNVDGLGLGLFEIKRITRAYHVDVTAEVKLDSDGRACEFFLKLWFYEFDSKY